MLESAMRRILIFLLLLCLAACDRDAEPPEPVADEPQPMTLSAARFADLPGWGEDRVAAALPALQRSCRRLLQRPVDQPLGRLPLAGEHGDWSVACQALTDLPAGGDVRTLLETHFRPWQVAAGDDPEGLFTGYFEASLDGSRQRQGDYTIPLHARPDDLVMVDLGRFREELKGQRIAGRVGQGRLHPYEPRERIVAGDWPHHDQVLFWVDDAVDAFFLQIQGSGVIRLAEGGTQRVGYAGQNGHPYYAIGRELVRRGALTPETVSMQSIRQWLADNPEQADTVMNTNASYVFFREIEGEGPIGAEGVALIPGRSLAVDRTLIPYGVPVWLASEPPAPQEAPLRRLLVAQDTGGAIRGAVRGDVFWGSGERAEWLAGQMKSRGQYWLLLPRHLAAVDQP